jgi:hypothetical protein
MLRLKHALWTALVAVAFLTVPLYAALTDDLKAFYELDNTSDAHSGGYTLTNVNTVTFVSGKVGNAGDFEASSSQELTRADNADLSCADVDFTLTAWVNAESLAATAAIVAKDAGLSDGYVLIYRAGGLNRFGFEVNGGSIYGDTLGAPSTGTWYFIVARHNASANTLSIQVNDGGVDSTSFSAGCDDEAGPFSIGSYSVYGQYWDGLIDQVGWWKGRVLSSGEATELYNSSNGLSYAAMGGGGGSPAPCRLLLLGVGCDALLW